MAIKNFDSQIVFRAKSETKEHLEKIAQLTGRDKGDIVRELLEKPLKRKLKRLENAQEQAS